jgi:hypothetical protein
MPSVLGVVGDTSAFQAEMIGSIPIGRSNLIKQTDGYLTAWQTERSEFCDIAISLVG